jgi:hypothetical protein
MFTGMNIGSQLPSLHGVTLRGGRSYPPEIRRLVEDVIDSFEKLEILVYLFKVRVGTRATLKIAEVLSLPVDRTRDAVAGLAQAGLVRTLEPYGSGWWFDPNSAQAPTVYALARMYEDSRPSVIELVSRAAFAARQRAARSGR